MPMIDPSAFRNSISYLLKQRDKVIEMLGGYKPDDKEHALWNATLRQMDDERRASFVNELSLLLNDIDTLENHADAELEELKKQKAQE